MSEKHVIAEQFIYEPISTYYYVEDDSSAMGCSSIIYKFLDRLWDEIRELEFQADRERFLNSKRINKVKIEDLKRFATLYEERWAILAKQEEIEIDKFIATKLEKREH